MEADRKPCGSLKNLQVVIKRWNRMENFEEFFEMLKGMLKDIYGSQEKGLRIYTDRYGAVDYYRNYKAPHNSFLLVAENRGKPVGFLYARRRKGCTYIYDLYVKPGWRRKCVAKSLICNLSRLSPPPFKADTHEGALKAFVKLGFKPVAEYTEDGVKWFTVTSGDACNAT
jgi:GNAT superfamily N-acetyltransferase